MLLHQRQLYRFFKILGGLLSVSHQFLQRPHNWDRQNLANKWLKSYLLNRQQFFWITNLNAQGYKTVHNSEMKISISGIPQGSILRPILFICYF